MPEINNNESQFDKYLLQEYSTISEAHFKTIETISAFFKNYLLLMTIPITLIVSSIGLVKDQTQVQTSAIGLIKDQTQVQTSAIGPVKDQTQAQTSAIGPVKDQTQAQTFVHSFTSVAGWILIIISIIGITVFMYIINLRLDAILYARSINGIRKYFYESSGQNITVINRFRVLPQSTSIPSYFESYYFIPVLLSFGIFNGSYLSLGYNLIRSIHTFPNICIITITIIIHYIIYYLYSRHMEYGYLKSNIIGIDIDGVLNKHRIQFCSFYNMKNSGKNINPDNIVHIPVHEDNKLGVTKEEEDDIFNNPKYWIDMPSEENIKSVLNKLKKIFKFKLFIFTHRPWPSFSKEERKNNKDLIKSWKRSIEEYEISLAETNKNLKVKKYCIIFKNIVLNTIDFRNKKMINRITKLWLKSNGAIYNKLIIEKGNEHVTDLRAKFNNRFIKSRRAKIRYFIEDDLEKAIKLSFICEYVFLIQHPYNTINSSTPKNIIVVNSWNEIYRNIRSLS